MFKLQIFLQNFLCVSSIEGSPTPLFMASSKGIGPKQFYKHYELWISLLEYMPTLASLVAYKN